MTNFEMLVRPHWPGAMLSDRAVPLKRTLRDDEQQFGAGQTGINNKKDPGLYMVSSLQGVSGTIVC
jgi:hypothetical protein